MRSSHRSVKAARSGRARLTIISAVAAFSLILGQGFVALAGTASDPRGRDGGTTSDTKIVSDSGRASASTKSGSTSTSTRTSQSAEGTDKVFVCKYVGTPGVDERLQTGDNPISVSVSSTGGTAVGSYFNDAQGRSFVLALDTGQKEPPVTDCPPGDTPPPPQLAGTPSLSITKTADATTVLAGSPIGFTITVNSTGSATATGVTLSDPLPSGTGISWSVAGGSGAGQCSISGNSLSCNFGDMGAGTSKSVHLTSPTTVDSCGTYNNTATVSSTNAGSHSASASVTVQCPAIQVVKSAHPDHGGPGDTITYRYVVTNIGSVDLFDISVDDDVLGHICDILLLHPGESQTCTKDYVIPDNTNISIKNVVVATGHDAEGNEVSDDDTVTIDVILGSTVTPTPTKTPPTKTPPAGVAFTGSSAVIPLGGIALLLLMVGTALMWLGRRGRHATTR